MLADDGRAGRRQHGNLIGGSPRAVAAADQPASTESSSWQVELAWSSPQVGTARSRPAGVLRQEQVQAHLDAGAGWPS